MLLSPSGNDLGFVAGIGVAAGQQCMAYANATVPAVTRIGRSRFCHHDRIGRDGQPKHHSELRP